MRRFSVEKRGGSNFIFLEEREPLLEKKYKRGRQKRNGEWGIGRKKIVRRLGMLFVDMVSERKRDG